MSHAVLDLAYLVDEPEGIVRHRVVAPALQTSHCRYPAQPAPAVLLGVAMMTQSRVDRAITVRRLGIAPIEAAGAIEAGDFVRVGDDEGRIVAAARPFATCGDTGTSNELTVRARTIAGRSPVSRLVIDATGNNAPLSITVAGDAIIVSLATDGGGDATTTAVALAEALNADPDASRVATAHALEGATGVVETGTFAFGGIADAIGVVGIAQETAHAPGDVVNVLLIP